MDLQKSNKSTSQAEARSDYNLHNLTEPTHLQNVILHFVFSRINQNIDSSAEIFLKHKTNFFKPQRLQDIKIRNLKQKS